MAIRTRPLVIDRETGEPKGLYPIQKKGKPWRLVIHLPNGKRKGKLFKRYSKAKKYQKKMAKKYPTEGGYEYTIVSRGVGYGPPQSRLTDETILRINRAGKLWCPYCRKFRDFDFDPMWAVNRCPACRCPEWDFHVSKNNPIYWRN